MIINETNTTELDTNSTLGTESPFIPLQFTSFKLTEEERLLVIFICGAIVMVVTVATVCLVTECCWLFQSGQWKKKDATLKTPLMDFSLPPHYTTSTVQKCHSEFYLDRLQKLSKNSVHSMLPLNSQLDPYNIPGEYRDMDDANYGQVTFSLRFASKDKATTGQLCILLKEAQDLPPKPYGGACDPYIIIKLYLLRNRHQKIKQSSVPFCVFQSSVKKKTRHPLFMENFVVSASKSDLKICVARFFIYDSDKYANDTELGECIIYLKDYYLWKNPQTEQQTIDLIEPQEDKGKLCLGLTYLPTAQRVTFTIVQADHLKLTPENPAHFAPFVRVLMLCRGRIVQKRKTNVCRGSSFPVFNEVLVFDLPPSELENVLFVVIVSENGGGSNCSMEDPTISSCQKKHHVGKIILGKYAKGRALEHWTAMKQSPRKLLTYWHTLC
uniref:Synaptotagmin-1 n=1 Tax=Hadrurus spadix TaxID=141984 RepID=A0A1W7R9H2_9SCOR